MYIERVSIRNFKKIRHLDQSFGKRLTVIVGPNYSGKTTVRQAVAFALYGVSAVPKGSAAIKTIGASGRTEVSVTLRLKDGRVLTIKRSTSAASITEGEKTLVVSPSAVTEHCTELLGCDLKAFQLLHSVDAEEMFAILTLGAAKLTRLIEKVVGAELIDYIVASATAQRTYYDGRAYIYKLEIEKEPELEQSVSDLEKELEPLAEDVEILAIRVKETERDYKEESAQEELLSAKRLEYLAYKKKTTEARERKLYIISRLQSLAEKTGDVEALKAERDKLKTKLGELQTHEAKLWELRKEKSLHDMFSREAEERFSAASEQLSERMSQLSGFTAPTDEQYARQLSACSETQSEINELKAEQARISKELETGVCQACNRPFEGFDMEDKTTSLTRVTRRIKQLTSVLEEQEKAARQTSETMVKVEKLKKEIQELEGEKRLQQGKIDQADLEINRIIAEIEYTPHVSQEEIKEVKAKLAEATEDYNEARQAQEEKQKLEAELQEIEAVLKTEEVEKVSEQEVTTAKSRKHTAFEIFSERKAWLSNKSSEYRAKYDMWKRDTERLEEIKKKAKESKEALQKAKEAEELITYLRTIRGTLMDRVWKQILSGASSFVSNCTDGDIEEVSRGTGQEGFFYKEGEDWYPVLSASGYQRAALGLGVRIAILNAMPESARFMLIDEPTAGAREENSLKMMQALKLTGMQNIVVSHKELDATVADKVINFE